ncbi:MAG: hypothetical protein Q9217_006510 [Psora testacea]
MDEAICYADAKGCLDTTRIDSVSKTDKPDFMQCVITNEAVERRIACLELQDNDYFRAGMQEAVAQAEHSGFSISPFNADIYAPQDAAQQKRAVSRVGGLGAQRESNHQRGICGISGIRLVPRTAVVQGEIQDVAGSIESLITRSTSSSPIDQKDLNRHAPKRATLASHSGTASDQPRDRLKDFSKTGTPTTASATSTGFTSPSDPSTAISTPANPNFSIPLTGSPSGRKHRPQPLDLGNESKNATDASRTSGENKGGMWFKERMKARMGG